MATLAPGVVRAAGLTWPTNQLLPTFSTPAPLLDCVDVSSATAAEADLFASLQGIVNRAQPRIACVSSGDGEGKFTWLDLHNLPYTLANGYGLLLKYRTNLRGLVVTDPSQPDTLKLRQRAGSAPGNAALFAPPAARFAARGNFGSKRYRR